MLSLELNIGVALKWDLSNSTKERRNLWSILRRERFQVFFAWVSFHSSELYFFRKWSIYLCVWMQWKYNTDFSHLSTSYFHYMAKKNSVSRFNHPHLSLSSYIAHRLWNYKGNFLMTSCDFDLIWFQLIFSYLFCFICIFTLFIYSQITNHFSLRFRKWSESKTSSTFKYLILDIAKYR